jgi:hypothetical protein
VTARVLLAGETSRQEPQEAHRLSLSGAAWARLVELSGVPVFPDFGVPGFLDVGVPGSAGAGAGQSATEGQSSAGGQGGQDPGRWQYITPALAGQVHGGQGGPGVAGGPPADAEAQLRACGVLVAGTGSGVGGREGLPERVHPSVLADLAILARPRVLIRVEANLVTGRRLALVGLADELGATVVRTGEDGGVELSMFAARTFGHEIVRLVPPLNLDEDLLGPEDKADRPGQEDCQDPPGQEAGQAGQNRQAGEDRQAGQNRQAGEDRQAGQNRQAGEDGQAGQNRQAGEDGQAGQNRQGSRARAGWAVVPLAALAVPSWMARETSGELHVDVMAVAVPSAESAGQEDAGHGVGVDPGVGAGVGAGVGGPVVLRGRVLWLASSSGWIGVRPVPDGTAARLVELLPSVPEDLPGWLAPMIATALDATVSPPGPPPAVAGAGTPQAQS